jgi:hypothetical protein
MKHYSLLAFALILLVCTAVFPQPKDTNKSAANAKARTAADLEAERLLKERRANAQSLLINLAVDARRFNDATLRGRTLARVAAELWEVDRERARTMFRTAWDAAEVADKEAVERSQEEIRRPQAKTGKGFAAIQSSPEVRREVLRLAAKRDRALGEEFLGKLKEQYERDAGGPKSPRQSPMGNADEMVRQRLDVARQLLDADQIERALQFADPVLGIVDQQTVDFLSTLREKNASAADNRYAVMLASAAANPQTDANSVSLLSSYLFTPHVFISFSSDGTYTNSHQGNLAQPAVTPQLQLAFFSAAATILLRPLAPPGQEQTSAGHDGHYLVIKRLIPLFEQYAPPELTVALRGQLEALSPLVGKGTRDRDDDDWVRTGIRPDKFEENWEQSLLDQLDRAKTPEQRDQINLQLASLFAGKGDLRARDYVNKIDDSDLRTNARGYIDMRLAQHAVYKKDAARIMELIRTGELAHVHKAWLLTQGAKLLAKSDNEKALTLIDLAATEARRIAPSDADSPRAFLAVANATLGANRAAVWEAMSEAVKAANSAENFTGEDGRLTFSLITKGLSWSSNENVPDFDVDGIFRNLAEQDYDKAVELAQGLTKDAPRAVATIAIAKTLLAERKQ